METNALFGYIIDNLPDSKYHPNTQWIEVKCPYCDSYSSKRHFNIQLKTGQPLIYKCFRASHSISGILNRKIAVDLGLSNPYFLKMIQDLSESNLGVNPRINLIRGLVNLDLGDLSEDAMEYFKSRTGTTLTKELQNKFRISSSLEYVSKANSGFSKFNFDNVRDCIYRERSGNKYIYFFNDTFTMVYGREINGDTKIKRSLVSGGANFVHKPYSFTNDVDIRYKQSKTENTVFVAEGTFDIINAYLHIYKDYKGIFVASTGFTNTTTVLNIFSKYTYLPDIVILSDSDVKVDTYKYLMSRRFNLNRLNNIYLVYNKNGKDLGEYSRKYNLLEYHIREGDI